MKRRDFLRVGTAAPFLPLLGCGGSGGNPQSPSGGAATGRLAPGQELPSLTRIASGNGLLQTTLTAAPTRVEFVGGAQTEVWAYNQSTPGPLLEAFEGDRVRIQFVNNLPQPSNIHWHGFAVEPDQDGSPFNPVPPGGSVVYDFMVPLGSAGTLWYHPHPHMVTHEQVYRGLAGLFLVRAPGDPIPSSVEEKHVFITDLKLDSGNAIPTNTMDEHLDGREGNHLLVNGRERPKITIQPGRSQRWRIVNATNARILRLALGGHTFTLIGTDGGLLGAPVPMGEILLAPGERAEVIVTASAAPGTVSTLVALPYDRRRARTPGPSPQVDVLTLEYTRDAPTAGTPIPTTLRPIDDLGRGRSLQRVTFSQRAGGPLGIEYMVNGGLFDMNRVDLTSRVGVVEEWEVTNTAGGDHPFHIHGGQFQIVSRTRGGATTVEPFLAWRDTFNMVAGEVVRFKMAQPFRGKRVFHCHILEHEDHGMMGTLDVT
jgi:bilirubin oxidase